MRVATRFRQGLVPFSFAYESRRLEYDHPHGVTIGGEESNAFLSPLLLMTVVGGRGGLLAGSVHSSHRRHPSSTLAAWSRFNLFGTSLCVAV